MHVRLHLVVVRLVLRSATVVKDCKSAVVKVWCGWMMPSVVAAARLGLTASWV
jgi:hypothetical protein